MAQGRLRELEFRRYLRQIKSTKGSRFLSYHPESVIAVGYQCVLVAACLVAFLNIGLMLPKLRSWCAESVVRNQSEDCDCALSSERGSVS